MNEYISARIPLFYVFLSGIGFSLQSLIIKVITEQGFRGSFQCVFFRGTLQLILAGYYVFWDSDRLAGKGPGLFGDTSFVRLIIFLRSLAGFGSIAFTFLAVELIPIGDATVLIMLSPLLASILSFIFLGEAWRLPEFVGTLLSLVGAVMVAKPPSIFGGHFDHDAAFYRGVMFALFAAVIAACGYLFVRILGTTAKMPWANVCFAQAIGQIVLSIPSLYISGQERSFNCTGTQLLLVFIVGLIGAVSQILMTIGMQREKSAAATAMRMSDVAFGFLWQVLFTSDALSLLSLGGAVLVTCSILIIVVFKPAPNKIEATVSTEKAAEMRQLAAAMHSIRDSLQESYDLEPGFEHENLGEQNAGAGDEDFEFVGPGGGDVDNPSAAAAGLDSVDQSFLARMIQSPLYGVTSNGSVSGGGHQYSTLSLGLDDSTHNGEHTDL